ncbi:MAG: porin [Alphaproteobacteria bacterium]|nr:porin [Alphaproteobacteria bacterium]
MKLAKSLLLSTAAGLIAVGGAQAADLPVKAKAVEYVKVCSLYGPGFYYIPGTDTCIKLGGYMRIDVLGNTNVDSNGNTNGASGAQNRYTNGYTWRSRADVNIDTRTATEYGVVRTFFDAVYQWTSDTYAANGAGSLYGPVGTAAGPYNAGQGNVAYGTVGVWYAFIQFAGFTMGKAVSQFAAPWTIYPGNTVDSLVGGGGGNTGVNQFTYTFDFGQGVTASLGVQDQSGYTQAGILNTTGANAVSFGASNYAGTMAPDIVGKILVDQAWGLIQGSFAVHQNRAGYYGNVEGNGAPQDKWGYAGQLAFSLKNLPTGPGDVINVQGVYTNGATRYNIQDLASPAGSAVMYSGISSVGLGMAPDSVYSGAAGSQQHLVSTWGMRGAFTHNWDPYWNTSLYGAYASVQYGNGKDIVCAAFQAVNAGVTKCNPDYTIGQVGLVTRWTPVKNLTFSADVTYTMLDQNMAGKVNVTTAGAAVGKNGDFQLKDQNSWTFLLRAQRNW